MLRYSVEPGRQRANFSAVYALLGVVLIPISFLAIRLAERFIHPVVFTRDGPQMPAEMFIAFLFCLGGTLALAATLYNVELAGKRLDLHVRDLREALA
jgi:Na+/proline symporter